MNEKTKNVRIASFDWLRMILAFFVIVLHFNNSNGGAALTYTAGNPFGHELALLSESACICAVDAFMILSGYFLCQKQERRISKVVLLFATVMGYNSFFSISDMIVNGNYSLKNYIHSLLPINYFVWLYVVVYLLSPWINIIFNTLDEKKIRLLLCICLLLFVIYPTVIDTFSGITGTTINEISTISATDSGAGYTLVNFLVMYLIGAYLRNYKMNFSPIICGGGYIIGVLLTMITLHLTMNGMYYNNIFVVISAIFLVLFFQSIRLPEMTVVTTLASLTFPIFIIHPCLYGIWNKFNLEKWLSGNFFCVLGIYLVANILMYAVSAGIALIGRAIASPAVKLIDTKAAFKFRV